MQLCNTFLVYRNKAVRAQDDVKVFYHAWNVIQNAEQEEPDGDQLHNRNGSADVICKLVVPGYWYDGSGGEY